MDPRIREDDVGKAPVSTGFSRPYCIFPSFLRRQESIPASLQRDFLFKVKAWQI
jgi:hypothetical protein